MLKHKSIETMLKKKVKKSRVLAEVQRKAQKQSPGGSPGKHARGGRGKSGSGQQQWWQQDWEQQEWKPKPKGKGKGKDGKGKSKDGGKGKTGQLSDADFVAKRPLALALAKTDVWEGHAGQTQATSSRMQNP